MSVDQLRKSPMMAHLLEALERGEDIGHYGRLTFAMVARHFVDAEELVALLAKDGDTDEAKAKALVQQVNARGYSPPSRERVLRWQAAQEFAICPTPDDPNACNVYRELPLPERVFEEIEEFHEQQFDAIHDA